MLNISIKYIKIYAISTLGSLNIGKTILCNNRAETIAAPAPQSESVPELAAPTVTP